MIRLSTPLHTSAQRRAKDVFLRCLARASCPVTEIHPAQPAAARFGGQTERLIVALVHNLTVAHHRHLPCLGDVRIRFGLDLSQILLVSRLESSKTRPL